MQQTVGINGEQYLMFNRFVWRLAIETSLRGASKTVMESVMTRIQNQAKVLTTFDKYAYVKHKTDNLTDDRAEYRSIEARRGGPRWQHGWKWRRR